MRRRYRPETVRRLVFIGMLRDAGLDLNEIGRLQRAHAYLEGALLCRSTPLPTVASWAPRSTAAFPGLDLHSS